MYIENLVSDVKPELQPWGETKVHVPLNIRKTTEVDADGVEKDKYIYDCVERVEKPVTVENIVKVASKAKFGEDIRVCCCQCVQVWRLKGEGIHRVCPAD